MTAISSTTAISRRRDSWVRWLAALANSVVAHWQHEETIKMLRALDDHQLRDIGLTRAKIEAAVGSSAIRRCSDSF